jgi:hypothetical protein
MRIKYFFLPALALCICAASSASAAFLTVYGGPTYDQMGQKGYQDPTTPRGSAGNGMASGYAQKFGGGTNLGSRAFRWDNSGTAPTELGNLGADSSGMSNSSAYAINTLGVIVGKSEKYTSGTYHGTRAVRWNASGTAATELGNLGTDSSGTTNSSANAINTSGAAIGYAEKYTSGTFDGTRAVRWNASGTAATELGNLGTDFSGVTYSQANSVNSASAAVGSATKFNGNTSLGLRAVRWGPAAAAATELGNLGTSSSGFTYSEAYAVNTAGTAVGYASSYSGGIYYGTRAVRWDSSSTAASALGNLGTDINGITQSEAIAVNTAGTAVGSAEEYERGEDRGSRAVRWDATSTVATELGNLGTDPSGNSLCQASAINSAGEVVGSAHKYNFYTDLGQRAVLWNSDAGAIDLNDLIDPNSGWTLTEADGISDTNWVTGTGTFDPDGAGPLAAYGRAFLLNISNAIPTSGLAGDYNGNAIVDAADYTVWRDHLGQSITLPNDTTPGSVTQADYDVWKSNFGNHSGSGSGASAAVPEPTSQLLLLSGILAISSGRCQKGRKLIDA